MRSAEVPARFTEVESGQRDVRPELAKAQHPAKVAGVIRVIAKLDPLSRYRAVLWARRDSGVRILATDIQEASDLTLGGVALGGSVRAENELLDELTKRSR